MNCICRAILVAMTLAIVLSPVLGLADAWGLNIALTEDANLSEYDDGAIIGKVRVNSGRSTNIRNGPGTEYKVVKIGRGGDEFTCIGRTVEGWYVLRLSPGNLAYVSYKYTTLDISAHHEPDIDNPLPIMSVRASSERERSTYKDGTGVYWQFYASYMLDGDLTTTWTPAIKSKESGNGVGEYADFIFRSPVTIESVQLLNGYQRLKEAFYENSRPSRVEISFRQVGQTGFSDSIEFDLNDHMVGWQHLSFAPKYNVDAFRIKVLNIYAGTKYVYDLGITEVRASGIK